MRLFRLFALLVIVWRSGLARAQVKLLAGGETQCVFSAHAPAISLIWTNESDSFMTVPVRFQLYQASSSTAASMGGPQNWKQLQMLPHQTVLDTAVITFPPVDSAARFVIQWLDETNKVLGKTDLLVYPTNLLDELKPLLGEGDDLLGVLDPENQIKPAIKSAGIPFVNLEESRLENFSGKLALIGSCGHLDPGHHGLSARIRKLSLKGRGVVWIQSMSEKCNHPSPSFFVLPHNAAAVVIAGPALAADLIDSPKSQLDLVYLCKLALRAESLEAPDLESPP